MLTLANLHEKSGSLSCEQNAVLLENSYPL